MKKFRLMTILFLTLSLLIINVQPVGAFPPLPSGFYGTVKIDGANVPTGTVVYAQINGITYANATVQLYQGDTVYSLDVPGDDTDSPDIVEGGVAGNTVTFLIGSVPAVQTGPFVSPSNVSLNLTGFTPPVAFNKTSPASGATNVAINTTLSWAASSNATSYEYCYDTSNDSACSGTWTSTAGTTSPALALSNNMTYYWQVRANNSGGTTMASGGYWNFTTIVAPPAAFNKSSPSNAATSVALNPTLSWAASSGASSYEYCYATTTGCTSWISLGNVTSIGISGLTNNQVYYWQVRAINGGGTTPANTGTYWSFTTVVAAPAAFNKTGPANAATGVAINPTLSWAASTGATSYDYCYATTTGCTNWTSLGTVTSIGISGLNSNTIYYWQVRAVNAGGNTLANTGTYWSFTTIVAAPAAFNKTSPANAATGVAINPTLSWATSTGATSYEYCYATTTGCTSWTSVGTVTSVGISGLEQQPDLLLAGARRQCWWKHVGQHGHLLVLHHHRGRSWRLQQDHPGQRCHWNRDEPDALLGYEHGRDLV